MNCWFASLSSTGGGFDSCSRSARWFSRCARATRRFSSSIICSYLLVKRLRDSSDRLRSSSESRWSLTGRRPGVVEDDGVIVDLVDDGGAIVVLVDTGAVPEFVDADGDDDFSVDSAGVVGADKSSAASEGEVSGSFSPLWSFFTCTFKLLITKPQQKNPISFSNTRSQKGHAKEGVSSTAFAAFTSMPVSFSHIEL